MFGSFIHTADALALPNAMYGVAKQRQSTNGEYATTSLYNSKWLCKLQ